MKQISKEFNKLNIIESSIIEHSLCVNFIKEIKNQIIEFEKIIFSTFQKNKKLLICGNGGSSADAQHFSSELVGRFEDERKGFEVFSLSTDVSSLTAIGNDYGYESLFQRQIESIGNKGDTLLVLSTSGNSKNLIKAAQVAKIKEIKTIGLLGKEGGELKNILDRSIIVKSKRTCRIQEMHGLIIHILCELIDMSVKV